MTASPDGSFPVPQPDTLLYAQAARRICEGAPFSFSAGTAASTGTTSVLYPFALAVPYCIGFRGDSLFAAGFWLNALFYLVFLWGWTAAICRWVRDDRAKRLAVVLLALLGHAAYCALAQSDIGIWMAASALVAAGLATNRPVLLAASLAVAPWVRPEGVFCGLALVAVVVWRRAFSRRIAAVGALWALSVAGVFALNYALTGAAQFASVANKGYLSQYGFAAAVQKTFADGVLMFMDLFLSLSREMPRSLDAVPVVGGIVFLCGLFAHDWRAKTAPRQVAWLIALGLGFASVAQSGWQNTNVDRYMAWVLPIVPVFAAEGAVWLADRMPRSPLSRLLAPSLVAFAVLGSVVYACIFHGFARDGGQLRAFAVACEGVMPKGASVAANGECGVAYFMSPRRVAHLSAMYSPEFKFMGMAERMDDLKRNPGKRFDYWCLEGEFSELRASSFSESAFGPCVLAGPGSRGLYKADWAAYDEADRAPAALPRENLVCRVDVGYPPDEDASRYDVVDRFSRRVPPPFFICARDRSGRVMADAGRVVMGGDEMDVPAAAGRDVRVVMRVFSSGASTIDDGIVRQEVRGGIPESFSMNVAVDGQVVRQVSLRCDKGLFTDVSFTIPGAAFRGGAARVAFLGDHIPFGYWFFQEGGE